MRSQFLLLILFAAQFNLWAQGTLTYRLLPDSSVTPHDGSTSTGPSESLTGIFTWSPLVPSRIIDSFEFSIDSLSFRSPSYSLQLTGSSQPDNITQIGPDGGTAVNAIVNWQTGPQNPYFIGGFGQGTYTGPADAPTRLILTEGLGPSAGGSWIAYLYIDAQLVPEPSSPILIVIAFCGWLVFDRYSQCRWRAPQISS